MCNVERKRWGFTIDEMCSICKDGKEDVEHIFKHCPEGKHM